MSAIDGIGRKRLDECTQLERVLKQAWIMWNVPGDHEVISNAAAELKAKDDMLKCLEWSGTDFPTTNPACPICGGVEQGYGGNGHLPDCELAALIEKAKR